MRFALALLALTLAAMSEARAQPLFDKVFMPDTIGPGSASMLVFTIDNSGSGGPVEDLAFTDVLPAPTTLAAPGFVSNSCGGTVSAPDGGGTVSLTDGQIGAFGTCEIVVNVTSSTPGTHTNPSVSLTSSAGMSNSLSADLTVSTDRPGFTKGFAPSTVEFGGRSTLTFTVDNTANASPVSNLSFTDALPAGMTVADPANAATDCATAPFTGTLTAQPGGGTISYSYFSNSASFPSVDAEATCTVTVDVIGGAVGSLGNVSDDLEATVSFSSRSSGKAAAVLEVTSFTSLLSLEKEFTDDPAAPGGTTTLEFTITNRSRRDSASGITFTDDLDAALSGLVATGLPASGVCGAGSEIAGTSTLTLTGGNLAPEASCTFSVTLSVPADAAPGTYPNTTGAVSGDVGGSAETGNTASDALFVVPFPVLTKAFTDDPVGAGGTVTLEFTVTNTSTTSTMTDIAFTDEFDVILPTSPSGAPADGFCGAGSTATYSPLINPLPPGSAIPATLDVSGASLTPGSSCTFTIELDVAAGASAGSYANTTTQPTATVDGSIVTGPAASDDVVVVGAPRLTKEFTDDPVAPGDTVTLEFTLEHDALAPGDATGIAFTDNLDDVLTGLVATGLPASDVCGAGSEISGTSLLTLTDGNLARGASCTFSVTLQAPANAVSGIHANTTSAVTATVDGVAATGSPAEDDLVVTGLLLTKAFTDDPVVAGGTATLRFTLDNSSGSDGASDISFTDDLDDALTSLSASLPPNPDPPCGASSSLGGVSGNTLLVFSNGEVAAGDSCSFEVTVTVPGGTADDTYLNATSSLSATIGGNTATLPVATDVLTVDSSLIGLTKEFTDDPATPGDTVTLEFVVTNLSATESITGIAFTDDLDAVLPGLAAAPPPAPDPPCGVGSSLSGTSVLSLTGGSLAAGASCTFTVSVNVPGAATGGSFVNTTSTATGTVAGPLTVTGGPASDTLQIQSLSLAKDFTDDPTVAGGTATLEFTISNVGSDPVSGLSFTDDLDAVLSGLTAALPPSPDPPCGASSSLAGTSFLTFSGGSLAATGSPGDSCTFSVTVQIPAGASDGTFVNATSDLFAAGLSVADSATANLEIEPPPGFGKSFTPDLIATGGISTLTFTINNNASALAATALDFTDNLPAGVTVANPANDSTSCTGGTLTAAPGAGVVTYTGGTVNDNSTCTVSVDVTSSTVGAHVNTSGDLTSSSGNSGTATDTLEVDTDTDGDGLVDSVDPDDDNDGLDDVDDSAPKDPDRDGDQIKDGVDPEPDLSNNFCLFGMPTDVILENLMIPAGQTIVCGVPNSITVAATVTFEGPGSKLVVISQHISFENGFAVPAANLLSAISEDPTPPPVFGP